MPEVRDKIWSNDKTTKGISEKLQELVNPILKADVINKQQIIADKTDFISGMIAEVNTTLTQHRQILEDAKNKFDTFESVKNVVVGMEKTVANLQTEAVRVANESMGTKAESEKRYAEMQKQLL